LTPWGDLSIPFRLIARVIINLCTLRALLLSSDSPFRKRLLPAFELSTLLSPVAAGKE
jgi:hypothetical protein